MLIVALVSVAASIYYVLLPASLPDRVAPTAEIVHLDSTRSASSRGRGGQVATSSSHRHGDHTKLTHTGAPERAGKPRSTDKALTAEAPHTTTRSAEIGVALAAASSNTSAPAIPSRTQAACLAQLPIRITTLHQCRLRLFLLPSYPTSGNELVHSLFEAGTGWASSSVYKAEMQRLLFRHGPAHIYSPLEAELKTKGLRVAVGEGSTLVKSHYPTGLELMDMRKARHDDHHILARVAATSGVVRLVRNPGDQLLRNAARWGSTAECNWECFKLRAKFLCDRGVEKLDWERWLTFHKFWIRGFNVTIPKQVVRYEEISDPHKAPVVARRLFDFMGEPAPYFDKAMSVVRKAAYTHGALVKQMCGRAAARKLHNLTAAVSMVLGYRFNDKDAIWEVAG